MTEDAVRIIPLGGLGEIGKNMTAVEYRGKIVVLDCGVEFPSEDMLGIDLVLPDIRWLIAAPAGRARLRDHARPRGPPGGAAVRAPAAQPARLRQPLHARAHQVQARGARPAQERRAQRGQRQVHACRSGPLRPLLHRHQPQHPRLALDRARHRPRRRGAHRRLPLRPHADRRPRHRRGRLRPARRAGRAGAARRLDQRRGSGVDRLGEHRQPGLPPDLRRGRGPRDRGQLRLAHPPHPAGDHHRPPARPQVRPLRPLDGQERQHRPQPRLPQGAGGRDDQAHADRRVPARGDPHPLDRQPGRAALGAHAHGVQRPPAGRAARRATRWSSRPRPSPATSAA